MTANDSASLKQRTKPPILHSIFLTGGASASHPDLPDKIRRNIESFKAAHPGSEHFLHTDQTLRTFIEVHFDRAVLDAYDELVPLAYKADLGRYCLLYKTGGIYSDLSLFFFWGVCRDATHRIHVFRDRHSEAPWIVSNSIIAAPPGMTVFQECIDRICKHTTDRYYGLNSLCPTGPNLFGAALAASTPAGQIKNGLVVHVNQGFDAFPALAFLSKEGDLIAYRDKTSDGVATLGVSRNQTYNEGYEAREIYLSDIGRPKVFRAKEYLEKDQLIGGSLCVDGKTVLLTGVCGVAIFGPYIRLKKGHYSAELAFSGGPGLDEKLIGSYDIVCDFGRTTILPPASFSLKLTKDESLLPVNFSLSRDIEKLEIRINVKTTSTFRFHFLKIDARNKRTFWKKDDQ